MATEKQINFMRKLASERLAVNAKTGEVDPEGRTVAEIIAARGPESEAKIWKHYGLMTVAEMSATIDRLMAAPKKAGTNGQAGNGQGHPNVPEGYYATASRTGNNDLDFWRVKRPTKGRWEGYTFVDRVIGGHADQPVRGAEAKAALAAIAEAGPDQAGTLYGQEVGQCRRCNRHLTDEDSRTLGIGPECRKLVGA